MIGVSSDGLIMAGVSGSGAGRRLGRGSPRLCRPLSPASNGRYPAGRAHEEPGEEPTMTRAHAPGPDGPDDHRLLGLADGPRRRQARPRRPPGRRPQDGRRACRRRPGRTPARSTACCVPWPASASSRRTTTGRFSPDPAVRVPPQRRARLAVGDGRHDGRRALPRLGRPAGERPHRPDRLRPPLRQADLRVPRRASRAGQGLRRRHDRRSTAGRRRRCSTPTTSRASASWPTSAAATASNLIGILGRYPEMRGILFDLPHVVERASGEPGAGRVGGPLRGRRRQLLRVDPRRGRRLLPAAHHPRLGRREGGAHPAERPHGDARRGAGCWSSSTSCRRATSRRSASCWT